MAEEMFAAADPQTRESRRELADNRFGDGPALRREPRATTRAIVDGRRLLEEGARALANERDHLLRLITPAGPPPRSGAAATRPPWLASPPVRTAADSPLSVM